MIYNTVPSCDFVIPAKAGTSRPLNNDIAPQGRRKKTVMGH